MVVLVVPEIGLNTDNIPSAMGLGMGSPPDVVFDLHKQTCYSKTVVKV